MHRPFTYLALGDSYTIGESVPLQRSFPYQAVQLLRKKGYNFLAPEIIAKTGWTSDELLEGMNDYRFLQQYNFVTLLIGVNNQYRGKEIIQYKEEFEMLLKKAITLTKNKAAHVFVLSIPDYSVTPYAQALDKDKTSNEINVFNAVSRALCIQYKVPFINITDESRKAKNDPDLIATDKLHPSAKAYGGWAKKLASSIIKQLK